MFLKKAIARYRLHQKLEDLPKLKNYEYSSFIDALLQEAKDNKKLRQTVAATGAALLPQLSPFISSAPDILEKLILAADGDKNTTRKIFEAGAISLKKWVTELLNDPNPVTNQYHFYPVPSLLAATGLMMPLAESPAEKKMLVENFAQTFLFLRKIWDAPALPAILDEALAIAGKIKNSPQSDTPLLAAVIDGLLEQVGSHNNFHESLPSKLLKFADEDSETGLVFRDIAISRKSPDADHPHATRVVFWRDDYPVVLMESFFKGDSVTHATPFFYAGDMSSFKHSIESVYPAEDPVRQHFNDIAAIIQNGELKKIMDGAPRLSAVFASHHSPTPLRPKAWPQIQNQARPSS